MYHITGTTLPLRWFLLRRYLMRCSELQCDTTHRLGTLQDPMLPARFCSKPLCNEHRNLHNYQHHHTIKLSLLCNCPGARFIHRLLPSNDANTAKSDADEFHIRGRFTILLPAGNGISVIVSVSLYLPVSLTTKTDMVAPRYITPAV